MEAHLVACIEESLAAFLYDNACFLCERLVAHDHSAVSAVSLEGGQSQCPSVNMLHALHPSGAPSSASLLVVHIINTKHRVTCS